MGSRPDRGLRRRAPVDCAQRHGTGAKVYCELQLFSRCNSCAVMYIPSPKRPRKPTASEQLLVVQKLLEMCRAGKLNAVWAGNAVGLGIRRLPYGEPEFISWREAGAMTGVTAPPKSTVIKMRKKSA